MPAHDWHGAKSVQGQQWGGRHRGLPGVPAASVRLRVHCSSLWPLTWEAAAPPPEARQLAETQDRELFGLAQKGKGVEFAGA